DIHRWTRPQHWQRYEWFHSVSSRGYLNSSFANRKHAAKWLLAGYSTRRLRSNAHAKEPLMNVSSFQAKTTFWGVILRSRNDIIHFQPGETLYQALCRQAEDAYEDAMQNGKYGPNVSVTVDAGGGNCANYPRPHAGHSVSLARGLRKIKYAAEGIVELEDAAERPIPICDLWLSPQHGPNTWVIDTTWVDRVPSAE